MQQPVTAADPSRTPAPARGDDGPAYGNPHASYGNPQPAYGDRSPSYGDQSTYGNDPQSGYGNDPGYGVAAARTDPSGYGVAPAHDGAFAYGGDTGHGRGPAHDHGQGQDHGQGRGQGQDHGQGQGYAPAYGVPSAAAPLPPEHGSAGAARQTPAPRQEAPAPAADSPTSGPTYGPATLAGNARVTDAQRARLEGRSPIIEPGMQPAALTALLGLLLSGTAAIGSYALVVPLVALQAVTAAGWFRLNGMWPARQGIALAFLGALVSDVVLLAAGREHAPAAILGTLGVWVLLCLVLQLRSHADPDERMYGLMATVASSALAVLATGHLGAEPDAVTVGAAAVAVAVLARALPLPTPASVVVALLAAAGAGIAVGRMTGLGAGGALLGAGAAVCALIGHRVASYDYPSRFVHFTAGVALPLTAAAPAVYVLGRVLA
ncbi:hypothetical protein [Streptomyces sp. NPDC048481]|uniref:hypothetical protein n=1 Tax=Streptomyces sp. NPDC048481 TaxID=3365557 RepID=UPI003722064F